MSNEDNQTKLKTSYRGGVLISLLVGQFILSSRVLAANSGGQVVASPDDITPYNPLAESSVFSGEVTLATIVGQALQFLYPIVTILLFVILIWGGLEYMSAGVNSKSVGAEKGKKRIVSALLGFALVAFSYLIILVLQSALGFELL